MIPILFSYTNTMNMLKKIGLPRTLYYYSHYSLWETFLRELGFDPILSAPTSTRTVQRAGVISESEHCLPMKLFDAHLEEITGSCDAVLVPRYHSSMRGHISCPKMGAMPDVAAIKTETLVVSCTVDVRRRSMKSTLIRLGKTLGSGRRHAAAAAHRALEAFERGYDTDDTFRDTGNNRFLIIGHPYVVHDEYFSGPVIRSLEELDAEYGRMSFGYHLHKDFDPHIQIEEEYVRWDTSREMLSVIRHADTRRTSGIIHMSSFNCGCDSVLTDVFRREAQAVGVPYMVLVFDEHTARAGIETRIEAFVDSIRWRRSRQG